MIIVDQFGPGLLYRGPRPSLEDLGQVKFDINLEVGWYDFFHNEVDQERQWCAHANVAYLHQPMSDVFPPDPVQVDRIATQAHFWVTKGCKVLIHCLHGEDRTGIVIAWYEMKFKGYTLDKAVAEMYANGFHKFPYNFWISTLRQLSLKSTP